MMKTNKLRLVIDTNVLLVSIPEKSKYHWLYQALIKGEFDLAITNEVLSEYEEIFTKKLGLDTSSTTIRTLIELENVFQTIIYYNFRLIKNDPDDNKFADCAFASNANYLISNDNHFNVLKTVTFPSIMVLRLEEFQELWKNLA